MNHPSPPLSPSDSNLTAQSSSHAFSSNNFQGQYPVGTITLEEYLCNAGVIEPWHNPIDGGLRMGDQWMMPQQQFQRSSEVRPQKRVLEDGVDKAISQKQRRMIKNRESAARSREKKQQHIEQLEKSIASLKADNARLKSITRKMHIGFDDLEEDNRKRYKEIMENMIPVVEQQISLLCLRRTKSAEW